MIQIIVAYVLPILCIVIGMHSLTVGYLGRALKPKDNPTPDEKMMRGLGVLLAILLIANGALMTSTTEQSISRVQMFFSIGVALLLTLLILMAERRYRDTDE